MFIPDAPYQLFEDILQRDQTCDLACTVQNNRLMQSFGLKAAQLDIYLLVGRNKVGGPQDLSDGDRFLGVDQLKKILAVYEAHNV